LSSGKGRRFKGRESRRKREGNCLLKAEKIEKRKGRRRVSGRRQGLAPPKRQPGGVRLDRGKKKVFIRGRKVKNETRGD